MDPVSQEGISIWRKIFISPGESRLRSGWRLLLQSLLLGVTLLLLGLTANLGLGLLDDISFAAFLVLGALATSLAVTYSVYLARRFFDQRTFISLGLKAGSQALVDLLFGFGLTGLMMGIIFLLLWAVNWIQIESFAWQVENWRGGSPSTKCMSPGGQRGGYTPLASCLTGGSRDRIRPRFRP